MKSFFLSLLLVFLISFSASADSWKNLNQGDKTAADLLKNMDAAKAKAGPNPSFGKTSKEASFSAGELKNKARSLSKTDPSGSMVVESKAARDHFTIDPQKDPLFVSSTKILETPLTAIGGGETKLVESSVQEKDETLTCEEAGEDSLEHCTRDLIVRVKKIKVRKEWRGAIKLYDLWHEGRSTGYCNALKAPLLHAVKHFWYEPKKIPLFHDITMAYKACAHEGLTRGFVIKSQAGLPKGSAYSLPLMIPLEKIVNVVIESNLRTKGWFEEIKLEGWSNESAVVWRNTIFSPVIKITYEEDSYQVLPDEGASSCGFLENKVDQALCHYVSKACTQGPQVRTIEGIPISRECWQETFTYACEHPSKNDCGPLRARGCAQIHSSCKQKVGSTCVVFAQIYQCKGRTNIRHQITGGQTPFCLDGNCRDQSYESNDEMMASIAQLSLFKDMQGKLNSIFEGKAHQCSKYILSFKDCCGSGKKGWGTKLGLASCNKQAKELHKKRQEGLCHYVGTYCAKRLPPPANTCIKKKSTYCCFGSKLLKAFHEQGRKQIGVGWGKPDNPHCRGFTLEQIQKIDFSKLDLREAFEDLMKSFKKGKNKSNIPAMGKHIGERMETIQKGLSPKGLRPPAEKQLPQRPEA